MRRTLVAIAALSLLLAACRARVEAIDAALNAIPHTCWDRAQAEARAAEQRVMRGDPLGALREVSDLGHAARIRTRGGTVSALQLQRRYLEAIRKLLEKTGKTVADVGLWEINEAFSVVTMAAMRELELDQAKVNVHGGAVALGHPIGASGARIIVTLLAAMERKGVGLGVAAICIGGGEATAVMVERIAS